MSISLSSATAAISNHYFPFQLFTYLNPLEVKNLDHILHINSFLVLLSIFSQPAFS